MKLSSSIVLFMLLNVSTLLSKSEDFNLCICENDSYDEKLAESITSEANQKFGLNKIRSITLCATNHDNKKIGGIVAYEYYGTLQIEILWIETEYRKKGIGKALMKKAESIANNLKLKKINISTMECWDSLSFYKKLGYKVEFVRTGFDKDLKQYFLSKRIK
ncbi:MAG: GNAT family N-acetyltransferase [Proteobacteria bacterium]|nr:GNAT family N-acetyltransferase [Pseudomonadota bacterium]